MTVFGTILKLKLITSEDSYILKLQEFLHSDNRSSPYCLLYGHPVAHSLSPLMHNTAAKYHNLDLRYFAIDVKQAELSRLPSLMNDSNFWGANITIPYKSQLMEFVDRLDEAAEEIGAINTIVKENNRLVGRNTDAYGFSSQLVPYEDELEGERAIIFGTGGASKAVVFALRKLGINELVMVSRRPGNIESIYRKADDIRIVGYEAWTAYAKDALLLVNATPLGMEPNENSSPVRSNEIEWLEDRICYDLVYKPRKTRFLRDAEQAGGIPIGGLEMLIQQGSRSFEYWTGKRFPIDRIKKEIEHAN